ncbi:uncharacterized protein LOC105940772 [Maylandia zebra]|uniref:uncharacterized protein LOC105940772 n=1 Tax=Maylandia zebra TaxID=106582 RepID=UPI00403CE818
MARRSLRLQESGYYREDGAPNISYKETSYKVFRRRKHRRRGPFMNPRIQQNKTRLLKHIITFLMLPLLTFGIVSCTISINSKKEAETADTQPIFESQGAMIQSGVSSWTENSVRKCMQWVDPSRASRRVIQEYLPGPPGNCWPLQDNSCKLSCTEMSGEE